MAEGLLQDKAGKAGLNWKVDSAGTIGYHTGEPPHYLSIKVAAANGIDISKQRSRKFTASDIEDYDLIYAMASDVLDDMKLISRHKFDASKVDLFLNALYPNQDMDVQDPWSGPEKGYHEVFAIIDKVCNSIVKKYSNQKIDE